MLLQEYITGFHASTKCEQLTSDLVLGSTEERKDQDSLISRNPIESENIDGAQGGNAAACALPGICTSISPWKREGGPNTTPLLLH